MAVPCQVTAGQFTINGISLDGVETCLQVPQLKLLFDVGHCPRSFASAERLFLTHAHGDHAGGLINMLSLRLLLGLETPLSIYAPQYMTDALATAIGAYESMQGHPYKYTLQGLKAGDVVPLSKKLEMRTFSSTHIIEGLGYTAVEHVRKLRDEFKGLPGPEIGALRKQGADIFDEHERPLLSFPGDTSAAVLDSEPHLLQSRVLILEATYLDDRRTAAQCRQFGHVHLDELIERASDFENEHLVLTHFSQSYSPAEARSIVEERFAGQVKPNVHVFAPLSGPWPG